MKKFVIFFVTVFISCSEQAKNYNYSFTDQEFITVISDLYIAEQIVRNHSSKKDSIRKSLKDQIYSLHSIKDTALFNKELEILMGDTKKYKMVNDSVVRNLENIETGIKKR